MDILIIEDEKHTALDLKEGIESVRPEDTILAIIDSVESGLEWFSDHEEPDLIFSDIQLGDGLAFDLFKKVTITCPVIFCTAYDEYAIQAFQNNGIDYLLKPVEEDHLAKSLSKIQMIKNSITESYNPTVLRRVLSEIETESKSYKSTILVTAGDKMIPINLDDVSYFTVADNGIQIVLKDGRSFWQNDSLSSLQSKVNPNLFYRANRQFLIAYTSIEEVEQYFDRKLIVRIDQSTPEPIIISKEKATIFLRWLENR